MSREIIFCCLFPLLFDWIFAVSVKSTPELLYSIEIFSKRYSMGCSRSQAPMRLFLCIFDKVLGRGGVIATSHTPEQSQNLDVKPARSRAEAEVD